MNRNEYLAFCTASAKRAAEAGELHYERTKEENTTMFNALDKVTPGVAGVSEMDLRDAATFQNLFLKQGLNPLTPEIKALLIELARTDLETMKKWDTETESKAKEAEERIAKDPEARQEGAAAF